MIPEKCITSSILWRNSYEIIKILKKLHQKVIVLTTVEMNSE